MKFEINDSALVAEIVNKVVEQIAPLIKHNPKNSGNELMTVEEVADYLKVKRSSIYDKVHSRTIPFLKNGSSLRFRRKHIDLWLLNPYHPDLNIYNLNHNGRG
jgi:excisionase family DNA binding protein